MKKGLGVVGFVLAIFAATMPEVAKTAALSAIYMCGNMLIPSLFPFMVCANLMIGSGIVQRGAAIINRPCRFLFGVQGQGAAAALLGFISGYPAGAMMAARLYREGDIEKKEAERLLAFTNNPGPLFVIGVIGAGTYGSVKAGYLLFCAVAAASLTTGLCMRKWGGKGKNVPLGEKKGKIDPMEAALSAMTRLCGFVIFFAVVAAFLEAIGLLPLLRCGLIRLGIEEKTATLLLQGSMEVSSLAGNFGALPVAAALLSFGGCSVFVQVWDIARGAGLSVRGYLIGKLISVPLSALYCTLLLWKWPLSVPTAAILQKSVAFGGYSGIILFATFLFCHLYCKAQKADKDMRRLPKQRRENALPASSFGFCKKTDSFD